MSVENDNELEHEEPAPEEVTPVSSSLSSSQKAFGAVAAAVVFVIMLIVWSTYLVNDNWGLALVVVGVPIVAGFAVHRRHDSTMLLMGIFAICTLNVWLVYFRSPGLLLLALAIIIMLGGIRSILLYVRGTERETRLASYRRITEAKKVDDRLAEQLIEDERYRIATRFHPIKMAKVVLLWIVALVAQIYLPDLPWQVSLSIRFFVFVALMFPWLLWREELFCLTNRRAFVLKGLFTKEYPQMDLSKITDYNMKVSFPSRLLSWMRIIRTPYGNLILETAGQKQALDVVGPLPDIHAIHKEAVSLMLSGEQTKS